MSSSSMDATKLEFIKQKEVRAQSKISEGRIGEEEENNPQQATTLSLARNDLQDARWKRSFDLVVNPDRKLKQLPSGKDTLIGEVQQFVDHLHAAVPHGKVKTSSKLKHKHSSSLSGSGDSKDGNKQSILKLEKGRKMEMHLDVIAGDTIRWEFLSKSSDFCFVATYFYEDQQQPVCRTDGVKNMAIVGAFEVEHNGSFVLMWQNTQRGFTIDRSGIKISYDVVHIRSAADEPPAGTDAPPTRSGLAATTLLQSPEDIENQYNGVHRAARLTDDQKCEFFRQLDHIPNPITTTTAIADYFKLNEVAGAPDKALSENQHESKKKSGLFKMFEDNKHQQPPSTASSSRSSGSEATFGMKSRPRAGYAMSLSPRWL